MTFRKNHYAFVFNLFCIKILMVIEIVQESGSRESGPLDSYGEVRKKIGEVSELVLLYKIGRAHV